MATLTFLGAAQTVTGSRHVLITASGKRILRDISHHSWRKSCEMCLGPFADLTSAGMRQFNEMVRNAPGVMYASVVGKSGRLRTNPLLWPSHLYVAERAGPNDGVVPASSQAHGEVLREIEADHWAQIGWGRGFDADAFYEDLLRELRGRGL